jgi:hypothetical protein
LDEGANIDPKIPELDDDDDSLDPKSSEVKEDEEEYDVACFLPSILSLSKTSLSASPPGLAVYILYAYVRIYIYYICPCNNNVQRKLWKMETARVFFPGAKQKIDWFKEMKRKLTEQQKEWERDSWKIE